MLHEFITTYSDAIIKRAREKLTDRQGGEISFRNLPRKGCVFTIEMPLSATEKTPVPETLG